MVTRRLDDSTTRRLEQPLGLHGRCVIRRQTAERTERTDNARHDRTYLGFVRLLGLVGQDGVHPDAEISRLSFHRSRDSAKDGADFLSLMIFSRDLSDTRAV